MSNVAEHEDPDALLAEADSAAETLAAAKEETGRHGVRAGAGG